MLPPDPDQNASDPERAEPHVPDLLEHHALPEIAAALRKRVEGISVLWERRVRRAIPSADRLTFEQVRDDLPHVLPLVADALECADPSEVDTLLGSTRKHGEVRFHQGYSEEDLLVEYRILRRVVVEQVEAGVGRRLTTREDLALDAALDLTLQQVVLAFTEQQRQQIRAAAEAERNFLTFLSHDVRNNLGAVTLTLKLVRDRLASTPQFAQDVANIDGLSDVIRATVGGMERMLHAESLRRGATAVARETVHLHTLVSNAMIQYAAMARDKGLKLAVRVPPAATAVSDGELITLILQNLVGNAVKYSDRGRVEVTAEPGEPGVPSEWVIAVCDEGPGMAADGLKPLSEPFRRGETHGQVGTGLGLAIASRAARLLGSELQLRPTVPRGCTFTFDLPRLRR